MTSSNARIEAMLDALEQVSDDLVPWTLGRLEVARAVLWSRLSSTSTGTTPDPPPPLIGEILLSAGDVADRLGTNRRWVYRHAKKLGVIRISEHKIRFSEAGLRRFLKRQGE